jgi:hypothetical protein
MRMFRAVLLAALPFLIATTAHAAEKGLVIRAGDLMAQPFIDAAKAGALAANQPVTILARRGGWAQVEAAGHSGWMRLLNLRLEPRAPTAGDTARLRTGSSARTVTTGVKGMDEADIRNASPDYAQLQLLGTLGVDAAAGRDHAQKSNLKENTLGYLDKGRGR